MKDINILIGMLEEKAFSRTEKLLLLLAFPFILLGSVAFTLFKIITLPLRLLGFLHSFLCALGIHAGITSDADWRCRNCGNNF